MSTQQRFDDSVPSRAPRLIAGLMSGTSADGVDAALVEVTGRGLDLAVQIRATLTDPLSTELRESILRAANPGSADSRDLARLHARLGHEYARAVHGVCRAAGVEPDQVSFVGCHGQTVWHGPQESPPTTLQLGAAAVIAEATGISVVSDFRWRDLAAGGQGAPLVPIVDWLMLRSGRANRIAVNLGGIVNLTYLPAGGGLDQVQGFDVGPGNMVLDRLAQEVTRGKQRFDNGGRLAVQGRQIAELLDHWSGHPFVHRRPPKSTGREEFGELFVREALNLAAQNGWLVLDVLCTATHFSASCLARAVSEFFPLGVTPAEHTEAGGGEESAVSDPPDAAVQQAGGTAGELILSGGGVHNGLLVRAISERLPQWRVLRSDALGLPADGKEAICFAVLAALSVDAVAGNVPSATGASGPRLLGSFTPGSEQNWQRLLGDMVGSGQRS